MLLCIISTGIQLYTSNINMLDRYNRVDYALNVIITLGVMFCVLESLVKTFYTANDAG